VSKRGNFSSGNFFEYVLREKGLSLGLGNDARA
jgi:hypothetical protein